jgi:hypothetical protein
MRLHQSMKDAIASLLCRGQHCLDIPSQEQHAPEFFCLHTLSVVLIVVVIAGSTRGWCAQFAERIITIGSQHTNINICAQVEVIAWHTSSGSPRAEKIVIVFGETDIIHCAGVGIIAGGDPLHPAAVPGPLDIDRQKSLSVHASYHII